MVKKIKKRIKKGPKAPYASLLVIPMTVLYGPERKGRDFRDLIDEPARIKSALEQWLGPDVIPADRTLSIEEFRGWATTSSPGRLGGMFAKTGRIPMGPASGETDTGDAPFPGIYPLLAIRKGRDLDALFKLIGSEFPEVARVAFHNALGPSLNLIPGYDHLLHSPVVHVRDLNRGIDILNRLTEDAFHQAGKPYPGPFPPLKDPFISSFPVYEALIS
ncbi:MAG TPA: hypothetical protein VLB09_00055 [Nitrospiria bacterium]|nr:hypothetical protein [Nitrospiria bacterium]